MQTQRIFYFDALRAVAILCVILLHVSGSLVELMNYNLTTIYSPDGFFEIFAVNFFRIGVDLFLILSGALLLGRNWDIKGFFKKRLPRIIKPFVFWSILTSLALVGVSYFAHAGFVTDFSISGILKIIFDTFMFRAPGSVSYWYFWLILCVYLIMPVVNRWINERELTDIEHFLAIWILVTVIEYSFPSISWLADITGPIGLIVLGYYLRYTKRSILNSKWWAIALIVIANAVMFAYSYSVLDTQIIYTFHRYSVLEICAAAGVFCLFKSGEYIKNPNDNLKRVTESLSVCSYGIYLLQGQILAVLRKVLPFGKIGFCAEYVLLFAVALSLSWIVIRILARIPYLDEFVGVK